MRRRGQATMNEAKEPARPLDFGSTAGLGLTPERAAFEADAAALGFNVRPAIHKNLSGEPWCEYRDLLTGHRYAGFISAFEQQRHEVERLTAALRFIVNRDLTYFSGMVVDGLPQGAITRGREALAPNDGDEAQAPVPR